MEPLIELLKCFSIEDTASLSNTLPLRALSSSTAENKDLTFSDHKLIGSFRITADLQYSETQCDIPSLISNPKSLIGKYLGDGIKSAVRVNNYAEYHELKQHCFYQWIISSNYFQKVEEGHFKKPDIVCFGGRITDPLQSPLKTRFGEWEIFASKFNDTIFIWDKKKPSNHSPSMDSFYGLGFEALVTGKSPSTINEYEKNFVAQEVAFGHHQLLILSEIDAVNGKTWVEVKKSKECSPKLCKYLSYWAQSIVPGVNQLVLGKRSDDGRVKSVIELSIDDVLLKGKYTSNDAYQCLEFEDRFLSFIEKHLPSNDAKVVKEFSWDGNSANVLCVDVTKSITTSTTSGLSIPDWFVDSFEEKNV